MSEISGTCSYSCEPSGKCKVKESIQYTKGGKKYQGSSTSSCHSLNYGGHCQGTLNACQPCRPVCDEKSPEKAGQFEIPIGDEPTTEDVEDKDEVKLVFHSNSYSPQPYSSSQLHVGDAEEADKEEESHEDDNESEEWSNEFSMEFGEEETPGLLRSRSNKVKGFRKEQFSLPEETGIWPFI